MRQCCFLICLLFAFPAWAGHAYAQFGDIKYPAGFAHFDYADPAAPKGGEITLVPPTGQTQFDKYNPFTLKGLSPPGLTGLVFETLLTASLDEPTTAYGLLAQDVRLAADRLSVVFTLNPRAQFQNGDPVLALDVKHSFDRLTSKEAAPQFRTMFSDIRGVTVLSDRSIRFDFRRVNAELPLIAGGLWVFSHKWGLEEGKLKPFDKIIDELPIGSGPYRIGKVSFNKDISYDRDPQYWARDLNVRRGMFNFDRITFKLYKDPIAQFEGFKAGEFDYIQAFIARQWARTYRGRAFDNGTLVKKELKHGNAGDFQGFMFNTRLDKFKDVRVRQAIGLVMDFEWMNRQLFYNSYTRVRGYFVGGDFEATGKPSSGELKLLEPLRSHLPTKVFTQDVPQPPFTSQDPASGQSLRDNQRRARDLLTQAGWNYRDGALRNAKGEAFTIEFLDYSGSMARVITPYQKNLEKLGFKVNYKQVDYAIYQKRLNVFDFEIISNRLVGNEAPGTELMERYGSKAADIEGSSNIIGVKSLAVDALLEKVVAAKTRSELMVGLRALDRVLRHGYYTVPHWYSSTFRVAYRSGRFEQPTVTPRYYQPETWVTGLWWASAGNRAGFNKE